jgi:hypothetical protein
VIRALARWLAFLRIVRGDLRPHVLKNDLARVRRLQASAARQVHLSQLRPGQVAGRTFGDTQ